MLGIFATALNVIAKWRIGEWFQYVKGYLHSSTMKIKVLKEGIIGSPVLPPAMARTRVPATTTLQCTQITHYAVSLPTNCFTWNNCNSCERLRRQINISFSVITVVCSYLADCRVCGLASALNGRNRLQLNFWLPVGRGVKFVILLGYDLNRLHYYTSS